MIVADGSLIDLEIAGVNDDAKRCANGEGYAIDGAVSDGNEFDFVLAEFDATAGNGFEKFGGIEKSGFFETLFDQGESEAGSVYRDVEIAEDVGKRADVIFVAVRENNAADMLAILFEVGDVGDDEVDAKEFGVGKHHAGVDDEDIVAKTQDQHVHTKFAETTERNNGKRLIRLAQVVPFFVR